MTEPTQLQYELIFEGPVDDSPDTLRKLKAAFIAELEFSIEDTVNALQKFPITIKKSNSADALSAQLTALKNAGAKVLIVKPKAIASQPQQVKNEHEIDKSLHLEELWADDDSGKDKLVEIIPSDLIQTIEFEIESDPSHNAPDDKPNETKDNPSLASPVFELDEDSDLASVLKEVAGEEVTVIPNNAQSNDLVKLTPAFELESKEDYQPLDLAPDSVEKHDSPVKIDFDEPAHIPTPPQIEIVSETKKELDTISEALSLESAHSEKKSEFSLELDSPTPELKTPTTEEAPANHYKSDAPNSEPITYNPTSNTEVTVNTETHQTTSSITEKPVEAAPHQETSEQYAPSKSPATYKPTKRRKNILKAKMPLDIIGPIVVGALLLGGINWWYFGGPDSIAQLSLEIPSLEPEEQIIKPKVQSPPAVPATLAGSVNTNGLIVNWTAVALGDKLRSLSINVVPPPPAELTKEEIAAGKFRDPLVRKIELTEFSIENLADGTFEAKGSALISIDYANSVKRVLGFSELSGKIITDTKTISATVSAWTKDKPSDTNPFSITKSDDNTFDVRLNLNLNK